MHNWISVLAVFLVFVSFFLNLHLNYHNVKKDTYSKASIGNLHLSSTLTLHLFTCVENPFSSVSCTLCWYDNYYSHGFLFQSTCLSCLFMIKDLVVVARKKRKEKKKARQHISQTINITEFFISLLSFFLPCFVVDARKIIIKQKVKI